MLCRYDLHLYRGPPNVRSIAGRFAEFFKRSRTNSCTACGKSNSIHVTREVKSWNPFVVVNLFGYKHILHA